MPGPPFLDTDPRLTLTSGTVFLALLPHEPPLEGRVETNGVWDVYVDEKRRLDVDEEWPTDWVWAEPSTIPWKTEDPRKWVYKTAYFLVRRGLEYVYAEIESKHGYTCDVGGQSLPEGTAWPSDWAWIQLLRKTHLHPWTAPPLDATDRRAPSPQFVVAVPPLPITLPNAPHDPGPGAKLAASRRSRGS